MIAINNYRFSWNGIATLLFLIISLGLIAYLYQGGKALIDLFLIFTTLILVKKYISKHKIWEIGLFAALISFLSFSLISDASDTQFNLISNSIRATLIGLTVFLTVSIFNPKKKFWKVFLMLLFAFVGLLFTFNYLFLIYRPLAPISKINCENYELDLVLDSQNNLMNSNQKMDVSFFWEDKGDIKKDSLGRIANWENQTFIINYLRENNFEDWSINQISIFKEDSTETENHEVFNHNYNKDSLYLIKAKVSHKTIDQNLIKEGLFTRIIEVYIPYRVFALSNKNEETKRKFTLSVPKGINFTHNLNGEIRNTVLESNKEGIAIISDEILDHRNIIRVKYVRGQIPNLINKLFSLETGKILFIIIGFFFSWFVITLMKLLSNRGMVQLDNNNFLLRYNLVQRTYNPDISLENLSKDVKRLISESNTKQALEKLISHKHLFDKEMENAILIRLGNYNELLRKSIQGLVTGEEKQVELNQINYSILNILK